MCLICMAELFNESMQANKLKIHLKNKHKDNKDKSYDYFKKLCDVFLGRNIIDSILSKVKSKLDMGLIAFYKISKLIAKTGKPHYYWWRFHFGYSICGDFYCHATEFQKNDGCNSVEQQYSIKTNWWNSKWCRKSTRCTFTSKEFCITNWWIINEALLMAYVRFLNNDSELSEELRFACSLVTDTKGETIFKEVLAYFQEKNIPMREYRKCYLWGSTCL